MAVRNISAWIPIPLNSGLVQGDSLLSVVERLSVRRPLSSSAQEFPRLIGADVSGGRSLTEDSHDGSKITMYDYLYNGKHSFNEDEIEDAVAGMEGFSQEWLSELNIAFDNASIGVTGARSSTASDKRPYTSIYRAVRSSDSEIEYTANANYVSGAVSYLNLSSTFGKVETAKNGRFYREGSMAVLAHPSLRESLRNLRDLQERPVFLEANGINVAQDTIFGKPITWCPGAISSTSFAMSTTGKPLLVVVNRNFLLYGPRVEPQSRLIPASMNPTELVHTLQHRARRGFLLTVPHAAAVFEKTS